MRTHGGRKKRKTHTGRQARAEAGRNGATKSELLLGDASRQTPHVSRHVVEAAALWRTDSYFEHIEQRPVNWRSLFDVPRRRYLRRFHTLRHLRSRPLKMSTGPQTNQSTDRTHTHQTHTRGGCPDMISESPPSGGSEGAHYTQ